MAIIRSKVISRSHENWWEGRGIKRVISFAVLLLVVLLVSAAPVLAGEKWCEQDPGS